MSRFLAFVAVILLVTPAFATDIANGSFEDTSNGTGWVSAIPSWTTSPIPSVASTRLGLFFSVDGYSPTEGSLFAGITNNGASQTLRTSTFVIDQKRIIFQYIYATTDTGNATDPFTVTLMTTSGNTVYTLADGTDADLASSSIAVGPFLNQTAYDTGWRTFSVVTTSLLGQTAQLEFTVASTGSGVSGAFLDDVTNVPEPSTILLFGLGALGLTAYGRRRRRAKRA